MKQYLLINFDNRDYRLIFANDESAAIQGLKHLGLYFVYRLEDFSLVLKDQKDYKKLL